MKYKSFLIAIFLMKNICSVGQTIIPGTELQELVKIADVYTNLPSLSFDMTFTYTDTLSPNTIVDSASVNCKISQGRSFISDSVVEMLQGVEYNVYVDKEDSIIMASPTIVHKGVFQLPLMDSIFRKAHVSFMHIDEINDSTWMLNVFFNPGSFYLKYELTYNPQNGLIKKVEYFSQNSGSDNGIPGDHIVSVKILISNYSDAPLDAALFNENKYIYKLNGSLYLQPAWQQFQLQN